MFEFEVFRKQMHCIEESTCDIVGAFRRPGNCAPFASRYACDFDYYFSEHEYAKWKPLMSNPFIEDAIRANLISAKIKICSKRVVILLCRPNKILQSHSWISLENEYPSLSHKATILLVIFSTTHLCEKTFSALALIKTRQRNRLDADAELRLSETSLHARFIF